MTLKLDHRHKLLDGDLLLTTACPIECGFCVYSCTASKEQGKWMSDATIRRVADEYSKNNIGIRISGGEPFYDLKKLERCIDILLEYYKPNEVLIISSGFFARDREAALANLSMVKGKGIDTVVISTDRFHLKNAPLRNIENILDASRELSLDVILRISIDELSLKLIDSVTSIIAKYQVPIEVHEWCAVGRGEKLEMDPQKNYQSIRDYFFNKLQERARECNAPLDPLFYLTHSAKRSQLEYCPQFFPTCFPNGNVYGCSVTMKGGYMGNINKQNLGDMIMKWKNTLPGRLALSNSNCAGLKSFLPEKFRKDHCEFCKNHLNGEEEALGREFIEVFTSMDMDKLAGRMALKSDREYLLSFRLIPADIENPRETGSRISQFLEKLKTMKVRFVLSRPLPDCLKADTKKYDAPENCLECREMFRIDNGVVRYCDVLKQRKGPLLAEIRDREQIYRQFEKEHEKLEFPAMCKSCLSRLRGTCNGMCFKSAGTKEGGIVDEQWKHIFAKDVLFRSHGGKLKELMNTKKAVDYLAKTQEKYEGYFRSDSAMIQNTHPLASILNLSGKSPSQATVRFIRSLQAGSCGFAETTGEVPWTDRSSLGLEMFAFFGIEPENKQGLINFFQDLQNEDGGFGTISLEQSTVDGTIEVIRVLYLLGAAPRNTNPAIEWIKNNFQFRTFHHIYAYLEVLEKLGYNLCRDERDELKGRVNEIAAVSNFAMFSPMQLWGFLEVLRRLGEDYLYHTRARVVSEQWLANNPFCLVESPIETLYACKICKMFGEPDYIDTAAVHCKKYELEEGGFFLPGEIYIIKNNFAYQSLFLMDGLKRIDERKFICWLKSAGNPDGWGGAPGSGSYHEYTTTALTSLRLSGLKPGEIENRGEILERKEEELAVLLEQDKSNYHVLRGIKNIIETWMLLGGKPNHLDEVVRKVLGYRNKDGGFGGVKSYMYATFWAVRSLYLISNYGGDNSLAKISLAEIFSRAKNWINSCQNKDGGFGSLPDQPSTIQSTFLGLYSLWMIGGNDAGVGNSATINWLIGHQTKNGGFAGSSGSEAPELLHALYVTGSLAILSEGVSSGKVLS